MAQPTKIVTRGTIRGGRLHIEASAAMHRDCATAFSENADLTITVERYAPKPKNAARAYYFGVVVAQIRNEFMRLGNEVSVEDTHTFLKSRFLPKTELLYTKGGVIDTTTGETVADNPMGKVGTITIPKSIAANGDTLSPEFSAYIERCKEFGREYFAIEFADKE